MAEARRKLAHLAETVIESDGELSPAVRGAAFAHGAHRGSANALPEDLRAFVETVADRAWQATDDDVRTLLESGRSEDEVFELIVATAVGAGAGRLGRAADAIGEATRS